jgi:hypothetical protein
MVLCPCKEYLYFTVKYNFIQSLFAFKLFFIFHEPTCALLPGQQSPTLAGSSLLTIRCFFQFATVRYLTQEHLAATDTPPKWRDGNSQKMDIIDAGQSAVGSDLDQ